MVRTHKNWCACLAEGSLSMGGGSSSVMASTPTFQRASGVLDSDGNINQVKNNEDSLAGNGEVTIETSSGSVAQ